MKFCPQCGTTFEPDVRFCLECGFDKSSFEPVATETAANQGVKVTETAALPISPEPIQESQPEATPRCPQCASNLVVDDRFCQECGFDTLVSMISAPEVSDSIQQLTVEETPSTVSVDEIPVTPPVKKQFCPQCGSVIDTGERFCPECGFDTTFDAASIDIKPEPVLVSPVVEKPVPPKTVILPPSPEPIHFETPVFTQPARPVEPPPQQKGNKAWLWIVLIIIAAGALGAAGWFGYNKYFANTHESSIDTLANTKPMSLMDRELAKQRAKEQNQGTTESTTSQSAAESPKAAENDVIPPNDVLSEVILEVGRTEQPKNKNPKNPAKLTIQNSFMITRITTDHYNDGMGTPRGGIIIIKDEIGIIIGKYKAYGKTGKNGTPSAKWVAQPNIILEKGTYFISDSEMATWSKTFLGNNGFIVVEGYEME